MMRPDGHYPIRRVAATHHELKPTGAPIRHVLGEDALGQREHERQGLMVLLVAVNRDAIGLPVYLSRRHQVLVGELLAPGCGRID